jgi:hypothetical protein
LIPSTSTSLQTALTAKANVKEGHILLAGQTLNKANFLLYSAGTPK